MAKVLYEGRFIEVPDEELNDFKTNNPDAQVLGQNVEEPVKQNIDVEVSTPKQSKFSKVFINIK